MPQISVPGGVAHQVTSDIRQALANDTKALTAWQSLTPLARNEWICWVTFVKKTETRAEHVARLITQLKEGKRRPCCWIGCIHRQDKAVSPSVQAILKKRKRS